MVLREHALNSAAVMQEATDLAAEAARAMAVVDDEIDKLRSTGKSAYPICAHVTQ